MGFLEFITTHFLHAMPVLIAGAFSLAIMLDRVRALFMVLPLRNSRKFFDRVADEVMGGDIGRAVSICDGNKNKPIAQIVKSALLRAHQPDHILEHGIELALGEAMQKVQKRTNFLSTIANVATLLGLFGTIAGLIQSFEAVAHADAQQKSALLTAGIATAMNATMLGLGVAIPSMVAFSFLVNRANRMVAEFEDAAIRILDIVKQSYCQVDLNDPVHYHEGRKTAGTKADTTVNNGTVSDKSSRGAA